MAEGATLDQAIAALEKILDRFKQERYVFLIGSTAGLFLAIGYAVKFLFLNPASPSHAEAITLLGSSGIIATSSFRVGHYFNKSFDLLERLLLAAYPSGGRPE